MALNRYILGDLFPLLVHCKNGAETPTVPATAPHADVFSSAGSKVISQRLPVIDKGGITGLFGFPLSLDNKFSAGRYDVVYHYLLSTTPYVETESFEIVAGGHKEGSPLAMHLLRVPNAHFVLMQNDAGRVIRQRNPRIA